MADAMLIELFKDVGSIVLKAAKQEIKWLVGVDEEVQRLQNRIRSIKATLDDAEKRHAVKQRAEKLWLEEVQNQYYEMDDIVDTWNTARIRAVVEKEEGKPAYIHALAVVKKKVCSVVSSPSCCFNLPLRHDVAHMIRELNEKLDRHTLTGIDFNRQPDVVERLTTTAFVDVSLIIGRDNYRDDLLRNLLDVGSQDEIGSYRMISLVGVGGIGKTSLAQLAYNHPGVRAHFQQRMWVCVSDPFDQCKVAKAIIKEVGGTGGALDDFEFPTLVCEIQKLIMGKKYFLVLDDVWIEDSQKWEPFKQALKNGVHGCRILVTTRKHSTSGVMGSDVPIPLEQLSDEVCCSILSTIAFPNGDQPTCLEDLVRTLASKCNGLPLAAKTLGSLMQNKRSREQWNNILRSSMWELEDLKKGLLAPLLLSYYDLSSTMRRCFSSCAVFPKDHLFYRDQLVLHWIAQGYIESKADMELEVIAEEYFEKLAMRSFFQDCVRGEDNDSKIFCCKMHDIVYDFAQYTSKNESLEIARHLHLEIFKGMQHLESINRAKCLRTLFLLSRDTKYEFEVLLSMSFRQFNCLRSLILDCPIKKLPDGMKYLIHLRFLFMSWKVKIEKLPETFCNLCNLQTLKIENHGCFKKLPRGMSKLINLRHLMFNEHFYSKNVVFPKGIGKLTGLRTLREFNICDKNDREGCKLGELKNLNQLRGTLIIHGMENVDEAHNAQLEHKIHLSGLVLTFERAFGEREERMENDVKVLTALKLPPNLQRLEIWGYMGNTIYPNLPSLGQLPFLEVLDIKGLDNVMKVGNEFLGIEVSKTKKDCGTIFPNLKSLRFWHMGNWEEWIGMEVTGEEEENDNGIVTIPNIKKIMPCLQSLEIRSCHKLKSLPDYLLTASLKKLKIYDSELLRECYYGETREGWGKISRISDILFDGKWVQIGGEPQFVSKAESGLEISDEDDVDESAECVVDESGSKISDEDDVDESGSEIIDEDSSGSEIIDEDDVDESRSEISDEEVEVDNDEGPEICEADR